MGPVIHKRGSAQTAGNLVLLVEVPDGLVGAVIRRRRRARGGWYTDVPVHQPRAPLDQHVTTSQPLAPKGYRSKAVSSPSAARRARSDGESVNPPWPLPDEKPQKMSASARPASDLNFTAVGSTLARSAVRCSSKGRSVC